MPVLSSLMVSALLQVKLTEVERNLFDVEQPVSYLPKVKFMRPHLAPVGQVGSASMVMEEKLPRLVHVPGAPVPHCVASR